MSEPGLPTASLAAVHLAPPVGGAIVVAALGVLLIVWRALGRAQVPPARRTLRRAATVAMAACLAAGFIGLSVADPAVRPGLYIGAWSAVMALVLVLVGFAVGDLMLSTWLIRVDREALALEQGAKVLAAIEAERSRRGAETAGAGDGTDARSDADRDAGVDDRPARGRPAPEGEA